MFPFLERGIMMNATKNYGLVRRVDELGRIVLPREMRRRLHIKEGDPLELTIEGNHLCVEKYQQLQTLDSLCKQYLSALAKHCNVACAICNTDYVMASKGIQFSPEQILSDSVRNKICCMEPYEYSKEHKICMYNDGTYPVDVLYPIGTKDIPMGAVILLHYRNTTLKEKTCAALIAALLTELTMNEQYLGGI